MRAPRTIWRRPLALLVWLLRGGRTRLGAARLRRRGQHVEAVGLAGGGPVIIEMIRGFPDLDQRMAEYRKLSRWITSPNRSRTWV